MCGMGRRQILLPPHFLSPFPNRELYLLNMKKIVFSVSILLLGFCLSALQSPQSPTIPAVRARYLSDLNQYESALEGFLQVLLMPQSTVAQWQSSFAQVRNSYKRAECLLAFLDEENTRDFLNGAPLPTINRVVAGVEVLSPAGMQIIEETLYSEEASTATPELKVLTERLILNFSRIHASQTQLLFTDRQVMEAMRASIFRLTSMGLVGFDTPGSGAAIQESAIVFQSMYELIQLYLPYSKNIVLNRRLKSHFEGGIKDMKEHPDFDTFDRLHCIRAYLEPLYGEILELHQNLGIETAYQVTNLSQPLEYLSPSMFSAETFNDHYYSGIGAYEEKPTVISLGQTLFFDPILSENNQRACASCHQPEKGFVDGLAKSMALNQIGDVGRNAPTLLNAVLADKYFYDLRADRLESQTEHVIVNEKEFHTSYYDILDRINQSEEYREMFQTAFGKKAGIAEITRALAAYVRTLKSFKSPVDQYLRGERADLAPEIQQGFNLFMGKALCGTCHFAPTFSGLVPPSFTENESEVIGVPLQPNATPLELDPDLGRFENRRPRDRAEHLRHSFKTPTVRNIALTAPYMHNGTYQTLEQVVDFYNKGGGEGLGFSVPNQTLPFDHLSLSTSEQTALIRFMEALTDTSGLTARPTRLPSFSGNSAWNQRVIGGVY